MGKDTDTTSNGTKWLIRSKLGVHEGSAIVVFKARGITFCQKVHGLSFVSANMLVWKQQVVHKTKLILFYTTESKMEIDLKIQKYKGR